MADTEPFVVRCTAARGWWRGQRCRRGDTLRLMPGVEPLDWMERVTPGEDAPRPKNDTGVTPVSLSELTSGRPQKKTKKTKKTKKVPKTNPVELLDGGEGDLIS